MLQIKLKTVHLCSKKVTVDNETQSPCIDFDQTLVKKEKKSYLVIL